MLIDDVAINEILNADIFVFIGDFDSGWGVKAEIIFFSGLHAKKEMCRIERIVSYQNEPAIFVDKEAAEITAYLYSEYLRQYIKTEEFLTQHNIWY